MTDHVIGVDIGTTGTKTGIYDRDGRLVGEAFEESILRYPRAGEVEQDPEEIFTSVVNTVREAMARSGLAPDRIAAIALDGQMAGIMADLGCDTAIALGDAPNDTEMLETADYGVVIRNDHGQGIPALPGEARGTIIRSEAPGPAGWSACVLTLLDRLGYSKRADRHG